jgi:hypothetical protein
MEGKVYYPHIYDIVSWCVKHMTIVQLSDFSSSPRSLKIENILIQ